MNKICVFFAGDFCSKPSTDKVSVSDELSTLISSCDFKVVNFEVPMKPEGVELPPPPPPPPPPPTHTHTHTGRERFYQHDDAPDFLRSVGFNLFQLANNHAFDWGESGFLKTKAALGENAFGAGTYEEAYRVKVVEKDGVRIGFMALSFAAYTGVFDDVTNHEGLGCAYINDLKVNHVILEAKKEVDYLFVLPHDGIEYIDIPMPETIARYRDFIDYGADGVIGTHPHCPQGWETYKGRPIFYSLGNFLFNSKEGYDYRATNRPHWYEGLCVVVTIDDGVLSWDVVNTRNVDNVRVEVDHSSNRDEHNERICSYLSDYQAYNQCLSKVCKDIGEKETRIVDLTFHPKTIVDSTKALLKCWKRKITGQPFPSDYSLKRLLTHDARRHLLMWTIKNNS